jgi:hypothetical protein
VAVPAPNKRAGVPANRQNASKRVQRNLASAYRNNPVMAVSNKISMPGHRSRRPGLRGRGKQALPIRSSGTAVPTRHLRSPVANRNGAAVPSSKFGAPICKAIPMRTRRTCRVFLCIQVFACAPVQSKSRPAVSGSGHPEWRCRDRRRQHYTDWLVTPLSTRERLGLHSPPSMIPPIPELRVSQCRPVLKKPCAAARIARLTCIRHHTSVAVPSGSAGIRHRSRWWLSPLNAHPTPPAHHRHLT